MLAKETTKTLNETVRQVDGHIQHTVAFGTLRNKELRDWPSSCASWQVSTPPGFHSDFTPG